MNETTPKKRRGRPRKENKETHVWTHLPPEIEEIIRREAKRRTASMSQMLRECILAGLRAQGLLEL